MATSSTSEDDDPIFQVKLVIDSKGQRVLFAEVGEDFYDFMWHLLSIPVAVPFILLSGEPELIETMETLLVRKNSLHAPPRRTFKMRKPRTCWAPHDENAVCPRSRPCMKKEMSSVAGPGNSSDAGFVKGAVTYMVMDDLKMKPMSPASRIAMLNKFNIKDVASLQEKTVSLGIIDGVKMLKACLRTKNVLSTVLLGN